MLVVAQLGSPTRCHALEKCARQLTPQAPSKAGAIVVKRMLLQIQPLLAMVHHRLRRLQPYKAGRMHGLEIIRTVHTRYARGDRAGAHVLVHTVIWYL